MPDSSSSTQLPILSTIILWSARILTGSILCFWLLFITAHLLGEAGTSSRALTLSDYTGLAAMVASLLCLGLALKWDRFGAVLMLTAVAIGALVNWKVLLFPPVLIPIAAGLFLIKSLLPGQSVPL
jgi:hypothetical protein